MNIRHKLSKTIRVRDTATKSVKQMVACGITLRYNEENLHLENKYDKYDVSHAVKHS